ncbi:hypothetical protein O6H91_10G108600 [Diphasiastrum complanatum]|uniref:Uncharacterized protein n=1 Tax=Diphasiastrum complanatum TaxID=34168 RepID=A0ACC2CKI5_DIPCM|nr:hypothetical protein O6H91_10G108600 [Diphasiastrum complanatum]
MHYLKVISSAAYSRKQSNKLSVELGSHAHLLSVGKMKNFHSSADSHHKFLCYEPSRMRNVHCSVKFRIKTPNLGFSNTQTEDASGFQPLSSHRRISFFF